MHQIIFMYISMSSVSEPVCTPQETRISDNIVNIESKIDDIQNFDYLIVWTDVQTYIR